MDETILHRASYPTNRSLHCTKAMLLIYSIRQQVRSRILPNTKLSKLNKVLATEAHTQDWGIMHWRSEPVETLPEVPYVSMMFDDTLPIIPPPSHLRQLITHVNATHANELRQHWSTTGYGCCLAGGGVAYRSRTQSICAQSSTEAELIAANAAAKVTKYLRFILHELGYTCQRASCATYRRDPCTLLHERLSTDSARSQTMHRH